jgi:hypothetical protein
VLIGRNSAAASNSVVFSRPLPAERESAKVTGMDFGGTTEIMKEIIGRSLGL